MEKYYGWGLPLNASAHGAEIDRLIFSIHGFMLLIFIGWLIFLIYVLIRFRARPGHSAIHKVTHFRAPAYLEVGIALFEVFLLVGFSFPILQQLKNEMPDPAKALQVRVVAEQFAWNVHYPGEDGAFGRTRPELVSVANPIGLDKSDPAAEDDIVSINQFHIPVHTPVIAHLTSKDVIHSFAIPVMRVKQDTIPGETIPVWFEATKTGKFEIACAQLCGLGHYRMRGFFTVHEKEDFQNWLEKKAPKKPSGV